MKEVAVGIIWRDDRVLVCQRLETARYPLKWEFPGGKLERGESPQAALRRELKEELDIDTEIGAEFHRQEWVYPDVAMGDGSFRIYYHLVTGFRGVPVNNAFRDIRWVTPEELAHMDILEGNREALRLLLRNAKTEGR